MHYILLPVLSERNKVALIIYCSIPLSLSLGNFKLLYLSRKNPHWGLMYFGSDITMTLKSLAEIPYTRGN